jgi:hypothetical protein
VGPLDMAPRQGRKAGFQGDPAAARFSATREATLPEWDGGMTTYLDCLGPNPTGGIRSWGIHAQQVAQAVQRTTQEIPTFPTVAVQ